MTCPDRPDRILALEQEVAMPLAPPGPEVVRFGDCALDLLSGELIRDGNRCLLPDQPSHFGAPPAASGIGGHAGGFAARGMARQDVRGLRTWPERRGEAASRHAGRFGHDPRFIETLPRRGYRFVGDLAAAPETSDPAGPAPSSASRRTRVRAAWVGGFWCWSSSVPCGSGSQRARFERPT